MDVEIKVNFTGPQIEQAKRVFDLEPGDAEERQIWFAEIRSGQDGREALPLLDRGVIVRVRAKKESGEITFKLRGADGCLDIPAWTEAVRDLAGEKKAEGDWADRRLVSASLTIRSEKAGRVDLATDRPPIVDLMSGDQKALAGRVMVPLADAELLGPISSRKWRRDGDVHAEQWTVDGMEFLEISVVAEEDPERVQKDLLQRVQAAGLTVAQNQKPKTTQVLQHLAGRTDRLRVVDDP